MSIKQKPINTSRQVWTVASVKKKKIKSDEKGVLLRHPHILHLFLFFLYAGHSIERKRRWTNNGNTRTHTQKKESQIENESFEQHRSAVAYFVSIQNIKRANHFFFPFYVSFPYTLKNREKNKWMRAKWKKEKMVNHYSIVSKFPGLSCKRVLKKRALPFFRSVANTMEFLPKKKTKQNKRTRAWNAR